MTTMSTGHSWLPDIRHEEWRPLIKGWADDILPYYAKLAEELPGDAVVVEVGVCYGRSLFYLAEQLVALGKRDVQLYAVDWWQGSDFRKQLLHTIVGNRFNGVTGEEIDMVRILSCEGARAARLFDDASVAGVFIDSDHGRPGMLEHLRAWCPKVTSGGIIAGHDCDEPDWPGVREAVDEYFGAGRVNRPTRSVWEYRIPQHGDHG